jgi:hypothetical protein
LTTSFLALRAPVAPLRPHSGAPRSNDDCFVTSFDALALPSLLDTEQEALSHRSTGVIRCAASLPEQGARP